MSATRSFARARWARLAALAIGIGFAAAAAASAAQPYSGLDATRSARWPLHAADAAMLALFALLAVAGALVHPALLAEGSALLFASFLANYESESVVIPGIGVAAVVLLIASFRCGRGIRDLGTRRLVVSIVSTMAGLASIIAMQAEGGVVTWQRVRTSAGVETRVLETSGDCAVYRDLPKDVDDLGSGCELIIPARRARYVIGYTAASALLALVAVAGASRRRAAGEVP